MGTIDNSRQAVYGYDQRVEVFGSKGMVAVSNKKPDTAECSTTRGVQSSLPFFWFLERYTDSYIAEMRAFIECIQQNKPSPVTGLDARVPIVMAYAAKTSYTKNRPVKLSEIDATIG
jgi:myo-inositol 2-dehydrogenase/D-chiro-inositol 1-dehydrogenase